MTLNINSKVEMVPHLQGFFCELEQFRLANHLEYDLIHSHYWLSGMLGIWAQETWKRPHVVMFHSLGAVKNHTGIGGPEPEIRITTENAVIKTCHRILAPTQREKERLINFYSAPPQKIGVVPCGLACGIPVVATPVGVMGTIIKEGLNGQLVANGDAKSLARAIDKT